MKKKFLAGLPSFKLLTEAIARAVKTKGYLLSLDRHPLPVRSAHSALNTLLQSAGAIVMKKAMVILDANLRYLYQPGVDYEWTMVNHDEFQMMTNNETADTELVGRLCCDSIRAAGEHFKLRCPLSGEFKVGKNWKETH